MKQEKKICYASSKIKTTIEELITNLKGWKSTNQQCNMEKGEPPALSNNHTFVAFLFNYFFILLLLLLFCFGFLYSSLELGWGVKVRFFTGDGRIRVEALIRKNTEISRGLGIVISAGQSNWEVFWFDQIIDFKSLNGAVKRSFLIIYYFTEFIYFSVYSPAFIYYSLVYLSLN